MTQTIVLENQSQITSTATLQSYVPAWLTFLNSHVRAFWTSIPVFALEFGTVEQALKGGAWGAYFQDGIPIKSDLGYHDVETGLPVMRIDCQAARDDGYSVSEIGAHELGEAAVDPFIENTVRGSWGLALAEICDLFIMPGMTYTEGGVELPNFTTQAFWGIGPAARLDMKGLLKPNQVFPYLPPGGYAMVVPPGAAAWSMTNSTAELKPQELIVAQHRSQESARCAVLLKRASGLAVAP